MAVDKFAEAVLSIAAEDDELRRVLSQSEKKVTQSVDKMQKKLDTLKVAANKGAAGMGNLADSAANASQAMGALSATAGAIGGPVGAATGQVAAMAFAVQALIPASAGAAAGIRALAISTGTLLVTLAPILVPLLALVGIWKAFKFAVKDATEAEVRFNEQQKLNTERLIAFQKVQKTEIQALEKRRDLLTGTKTERDFLKSDKAKAIFDQIQAAERIKTFNEKIAAIQKENAARNKKREAEAIASAREQVRLAREKAEAEFQAVRSGSAAVKNALDARIAISGLLARTREQRQSTAFQLAELKRIGGDLSLADLKAAAARFGLTTPGSLLTAGRTTAVTASSLRGASVGRGTETRGRDFGKELVSSAKQRNKLLESLERKVDELAQMGLGLSP